MGARVIATAGSRAKLDKARELGADEVIDHAQQKISEEVRRLTGKRGVDVVFEHVGTATWEQSILSLATGGRLVTCGATTGFAAQLDLRYLFARQLSLLGSYMGSRAELYTVLKLVGEKRLRPVIDRIFPLAEAGAGTSPTGAARAVRQSRSHSAPKLFLEFCDPGTTCENIERGSHNERRWQTKSNSG